MAPDTEGGPRAPIPPAVAAPAPRALHPARPATPDPPQCAAASLQRGNPPGGPEAVVLGLWTGYRKAPSRGFWPEKQQERRRSLALRSARGRGWGTALSITLPAKAFRVLNPQRGRRSGRPWRTSSKIAMPVPLGDGGAPGGWEPEQQPCFLPGIQAAALLTNQEKTVLSQRAAPQVRLQNHPAGDSASVTWGRPWLSQGLQEGQQVP